MLFPRYNLQPAPTPNLHRWCFQIDISRHGSSQCGLDIERPEARPLVVLFKSWLGGPFSDRELFVLFIFQALFEALISTVKHCANLDIRFRVVQLYGDWADGIRVLENMTIGGVNSNNFWNCHPDPWGNDSQF